MLIIFFSQSASLLEPDIDDMSSTSSSAAGSPCPHQPSKQQLPQQGDRDRGAERRSTGSPGSSEQSLNALFKDELQLRSTSGKSQSSNSQSSSSQGSSDVRFHNRLSPKCSAYYIDTDHMSYSIPGDPRKCA